MIHRVEPLSREASEQSKNITVQRDGSFVVEVRIPDSHPIRVGPFATQRDAEEWIADHQRRVEAQRSKTG
jgi:hypothetical protein